MNEGILDFGFSIGDWTPGAFMLGGCQVPRVEQDVGIHQDHFLDALSANSRRSRILS